MENRSTASHNSALDGEVYGRVSVKVIVRLMIGNQVETTACEKKFSNNL